MLELWKFSGMLIFFKLLLFATGPRSVSSILELPEEDKKHLSILMEKGIKEGFVKPLPRNVMLDTSTVQKSSWVILCTDYWGATFLSNTQRMNIKMSSPTIFLLPLFIRENRGENCFSQPPPPPPPQKKVEKNLFSIFILGWVKENETRLIETFLNPSLFSPRDTLDLPLASQKTVLSVIFWRSCFPKKKKE